MSRRTLAWIVVALVGLLSIGGLLWAMFGTSRLVFAESALQARLNQQLPRTVRDVTIERVAVRLADNRVALRVEMQGTVCANRLPPPCRPAVFRVMRRKMEKCTLTPMT